MKCNAELNARQKKIMTYLLFCRTVKEAARKAGVRLTTVFKWLKDPLFKAELNRLREEVVSNVVDRLKMHCMKATDVLIDLMESENEAIRRGCANDILNHTHTFVEMHELAMRLERYLAKSRQKVVNVVIPYCHDTRTQKNLKHSLLLKYNLVDLRDCTVIFVIDYSTAPTTCAS